MKSENKKVSVEFSVKSDEFNKNLTQTKQQIKQTTAELQTASAKLNTYGNNIQNLTGKQKLLESQIVNVNGKMKLYQENIDKNNQKLKTNQEALTKLGDKKKELSSQYKEAVKLYGEESEQAIKLKEALDQCKGEYKETENKIKSNNKAINSNTVEMKKSETELTKLQGELKNTNKAIQDNSNYFLKASKDFKTAGDRLEKMGGKISDLGGNLMKLSTPILLFTGYAVKASMDFEDGMARVQAVSGATESELELLKEKAKEMGRTTKFSASESAEALGYMGMAGWKTQQMLDGLQGVMDLAAASGEDLALTSDIVTDAMTAFGLSAEKSTHFADVLAMASNASNTGVALLGESFKYVAPLCGTLGYSIEDASVALGIMANNGIKGSQAGTALKDALVNMAKPTDNMAVIMDRYDLSLTNTDGSMKSLKEVMDMLREKMGDLDEATLASAGAQLFGKEALSGMLSIIKASPSDYDKLTDAINNCNGTAKEMADIMNKTAKGQLTLLKSNMESLGISIGEKILPHINDLIKQLNDLIDWFGGLDESTQQAIIKFGLLTFASGGLLKGLGKTAQGIGALSNGVSGLLGWLGKMTTATTTTATATAVTTKGIGALGSSLSVFSGIAPIAIGAIGAISAGVYTWHEYNDVMNSSILKSTEEMSYMEQIIAQLTNTQRYSREELEKMGIVYKGWNSTISKETQQNLDEMATKVRNLRFEIQNANIDDLISEEEKDNLITKTNELCDGIIETIKSRREESNKAMSDMFKVGDGAIDEAEQEVLDILDKTGQAQVEKVTENKDRLNEIYVKAGEEKRELTKADMIEIDQLMKQTQQIAFENLVNSEEEKIKAQADFDTRAKNMNQENLSTMLIEKKTNMDEEQKAIKETYDKEIEQMKLKSDTLTGVEREKVLNMIKLKENERKALLEKETNKYQNYLDLANERYPELASQINKYTGEIMDEKELRRRADFEKEKGYYGELGQITEDGNYRIYNNNTQTWDNVKVKVDETTGEVIGITKFWTDETGLHYGEVKGYSQEYINQLNEEARKENEERGKQIVAIQSLASEHWNAEGQITDASGNVIYALENVTKAEDGTLQGVLNLNGTPLEVKVNKDGTISNLNEIINTLAGIKDKTVKINVESTGVQGFYNKYVGGFNPRYIEAEGGTIPQSSYPATTLGNERGMELWDSISGQAAMLGRSLQGDIINAPSNTKVTNALMTTAKMNNMINSKVNSMMNSKLEELLYKIATNKNEDGQPIIVELTLNNKMDIDGDEFVEKTVCKRLNLIERYKKGR